MKRSRRKPISFDTTLRNPSRIPRFISILKKYEGQTIDDKLALELEAEIIRQKVYEPTKLTLGTYVSKYDDKFHFLAKDQSKGAEKKVDKIFSKWESGKPGSVALCEIIYLLENTITQHKEHGWKGGWESRIHTQFNFLNELGFVKVKKGEKIAISLNGNFMIHEYKNGLPIKEDYDESYEQSAFLNAFSKYQTNNPYRSNTIKVNFFPLILNVIKYLDKTYMQKGLYRDYLPFVIAWNDNKFKNLGDYINNFRNKFGKNISNYKIYEYAMDLMDDSTPNNDTPSPAKKKFLNHHKKIFKYDKLIIETPDEIIRKLRLTMLVSLRGNGTYIDINKNEISKINYVCTKYFKNIDFKNNVNKYFAYMGSIDNNLIFSPKSQETIKEKNVKEDTIKNWAEKKDWKFLKKEMIYCVSKTVSTHPVLKYIKKSACLEFLSAIVLKKALPKIKVIANYKADDEGIPFTTASGGNKNTVGADIDVFEKNIHAIIEPTISKQRSFQVEHELPSVRNHVQGTYKKDLNDKNGYNEWFCLFIASNISHDVGDQIALIKQINNVEIYPWDIKDFVDFSKSVKSIRDYKIIRKYVKPELIPTNHKILKK